MQDDVMKHYNDTIDKAKKFVDSLKEIAQKMDAEVKAAKERQENRKKQNK